MHSRLAPFAAVTFAALCAAGTVVQPMLVGVMVDFFRLSTAQAGRVASFELLGVAAGSLAVAWVVTRWSPRGIALAIIACLLAGHAGTPALWGPALPPSPP